MNLNRGLLLSALFLLMTMSTQAQAQMWGTGMYPAMQACNYQLQIGEEATSIKEEIEARQKELKELKADVNRLKSRKASWQSKMNSQRDLFKLTGFQGEAFSLIENHIKNNYSCGMYQGCSPGVQGPNVPENWSPRGTESEPPPRASSIQEPNQSRMPAANLPEARRRGVDERVCASGGEPASTDPFGPQRWQRVCRNQGEVDGGVCDYQESRSKSFNPESCRKYLDGWIKAKKDYEEAERELAEAEVKVKELEAMLKANKAELRAAIKDHQRELREAQTEGGCIDCMISGSGASGGAIFAPRRASIWETLGQVALGFGAMYLGNQQQKYVTDQNARLGFATQPTPAFAYGFPYFMGGLYGAIGSGIGGGAFGCGGGLGGTGGFLGPYGMGSPFGMNPMYGNYGGAFGYPQGMFGSPMGGGMFLPGMGPWGGMPMAGGMSMCMSWPCPYGGMMGGGAMMGMPGMMMGGGAMMGMGMGMMMPTGYMMGMPMGGGAMMGMPGMMMGGGAMMGVGMMMPGGGAMMGMPGMMMGGGAMMGMPGMMMGGGAMMGMPGMMMGGMGMDIGGMQMQMQMQQAMMQAQMQQYQVMMQMQQQRYQAYMAQQQVVGGLTQELYTLMYRLQQAQMGLYTGGFGVGMGAGPGMGPGYFGPGAAGPGAVPYGPGGYGPGGPGYGPGAPGYGPGTPGYYPGAPGTPATGAPTYR